MHCHSCHAAVGDDDNIDWRQGCLREGWRRQLGRRGRVTETGTGSSPPEAYYSREPDPRTGNCVSKQRTDDPRGTHKGEREWWLWILFRELRAPIDFVAHVAESEPLIQIERYADFGIRSG